MSGENDRIRRIGDGWPWGLPTVLVVSEPEEPKLNLLIYWFICVSIKTY